MLIILEKYFFFSPRVSVTCTVIGSLSNYDDDDNDDSVKKQLVLWAKQLLCTCITLFSTFLWRPLHDYDVKPPNATFYGGRETSQCDVLYFNMDKVLKNSTLGKVTYIWQIERFQIDVIKFERTQIHFSMMFLLSSLLLKLRNDAVNEKATWSSKNAPLKIKHDFKT